MHIIIVRRQPPTRIINYYFAWSRMPRGSALQLKFYSWGEIKTSREPRPLGNWRIMQIGDESAGEICTSPFMPGKRLFIVRLGLETASPLFILLSILAAAARKLWFIYQITQPNRIADSRCAHAADIRFFFVLLPHEGNVAQKIDTASFLHH